MSFETSQSLDNLAADVVNPNGEKLGLNSSKIEEYLITLEEQNYKKGINTKFAWKESQLKQDYAQRQDEIRQSFQGKNPIDLAVLKTELAEKNTLIRVVAY